jgi:hypothetical protein
MIKNCKEKIKQFKIEDVWKGDPAEKIELLG